MKELNKRLEVFIDNIEFAKHKKVLYYIKDEETELVKELQELVKKLTI